MIVVDRRRSTNGLAIGGGILILALSMVGACVSAWGFRRRSAGFVAASKEWVDKLLSVDRGAPAAALELVPDELVKTGERALASDCRAVSDPLVGVRVKEESISGDRTAGPTRTFDDVWNSWSEPGGEGKIS
jgi:hypothetical protein